MQPTNVLAPQATEERPEQDLEVYKALLIQTAGEGFTRMDQKRRESLNRAFALVPVADQDRSSRARRTHAASRFASL